MFLCTVYLDFWTRCYVFGVVARIVTELKFRTRFKRKKELQDT